MKPERTLIAERALAQHCPALRREGPELSELLAKLERIGERLAQCLALKLAPLAGGEAPAVRCGELREASPADLLAEVAPLAANSLYAAGSANSGLLFSIEAKTVLRLIDRAFGGRGAVPAQLPDVFPLSAELMIARLELLVAEALGAALGGAQRTAPLRRDSSVARLVPFPGDTLLALLNFDITEADGFAWQALLALPHAALPALFGHGECPDALSGPRPAADPAAEPFAAMPLTVCATLVDMQMPVAALSTLAPGQVLPVSVARSVPLSIGGVQFARGTIGALDDRVAIQLTQAF